MSFKKRCMTLNLEKMAFRILFVDSIPGGWEFRQPCASLWITLGLNDEWKGGWTCIQNWDYVQMDDDFVGDDIDAASIRELWLIWTADLLQRGFFRSSTAPVKKLHCDQDAISERIHFKWLSAKLLSKISCPSKTCIIGNMPAKICLYMCPF